MMTELQIATNSGHSSENFYKHGDGDLSYRRRSDWTEATICEVVKLACIDPMNLVLHKLRTATFFLAKIRV